MKTAPLSLAAQAVNTAVLALTPYGAARDMALPSDLAVAAAALRAVADQVAPNDYASFTGHIEWDQGMEARSDSIREAILAIADELEGSN